MTQPFHTFGSLLLIAAATVQAQNAEPTPAYVSPCTGPVWWAESDADWSDFDFWVGEWQVYERETGLMMGFDHIEKIFEGCALRQHWRQMHDRYALRGAPGRMQGGSHTGLGADGRWHQTWISNTGSNITLSGGFDADGTMVLESDWIEFTDRQGNAIRQKHRWHWDPQNENTIHNWGYFRTGGDDAEWVKYYDIVYRRNAPGGVVFRRVEPES